MHIVFKNFLLILLGYAIFVVGGEVGVRLKEWNNQAKLNKYFAGIVEAQKKDLDAERQDFYGGKTPDETLNMFIEAMKKGDYDLARKYIASNDAKWTFDEMRKDEGKREKFIKKLGRLKKENDNLGYYIILDESLKKYDGSISMDQNLNGTWKITSL